MENTIKLPIYNINIDSDDELGIEKMSFVEFPAVEVDWCAFNQDKPSKLYFADEEKHIVTSVALRADYPIYRRDTNNFEYYVVFSKDNIKKIVERFFKRGLTNKVNLEHSKDVEGCYLIESYFASETNNFDVKEGSWICSYKVENPEVWSAIKEKKFNGFSVEGYFDTEIAMSKEEKSMDKKSMDEIDELIDNILK